ncbi:GNAT family N-acetyltransferase [Virgibacillus dakarensis]|uniref:Hydrolase YhcX n=1 Tax=Lentibacillus populi TaxID=1827502 RepID=A0A9W5TWV0_9BACI|nr:MULTISPECIES: bifunctional GNAT family N-acetyltransferase/carbon-nitrogen hydrolase family protein [Bacillaceae]MBT2214582.1 GNAT family N-acetyltransferase [Virgibacillus dakarensis]MTW87523.1 GNAT family N-acetyltransferase [Virgibacillus dakarensis]GGB40696.1 hydrolase YhcX [Lentibacillus populi]
MSSVDLSHMEKKLIVRQTKHEDIEDIIKMNQLGFGNPDIAFKREHFESQLKIFPEGQACIEYDGEIVGSCSSIIVNFDEYGEDHSFDEIADEGFIRNHNPNGKNLYGIEVVVHPDYRHMKIGRRLYEARRNICQKFNLKSILFGGRIPNFHLYADQMTVDEYTDQVMKRNLYDPVLTFQLMNGFKLRKVMPNYLPDDYDSLKYATLMEWHNPDYLATLSDQNYKRSLPVRNSAIQYPMKGIKSFEDFAAQSEYYVDASSKIRSDFVVFPELFTMQLLSFLGETVPSKQVRKVAAYTEDYIQLFTSLAIRYSINIVAGSHIVAESDSVYNVAYLFHRNGTIDKQYKLHISSDEQKWWGIQSGNEVNVFDTDCGKVAILIGYDIQFPELARIAVERGAQLIFTPYTSTDKQDYLRIRYCAQARAVENQAIVITAGAVGNLTQVYHMNTHYAQSAIFSPIDYAFSENGIIGESDPNTETMVVGEVDLESLRRNRLVGTVTPFKDQRRDLYQGEIVGTPNITTVNS